MAESVLNFVLGKLAEVAVKEVLILYEVDEQVDTVIGELSWIQAFLKDADKKQLTDDRQKKWVTEVRDVAQSIEDVIDTFLLEIPHKPQESGKMECIKRMVKKTKKLPAVHKLADAIKQIHKKIEEIKERKVTYGINNLGEGGGEIRLPIKPRVQPAIDPEIVGFEDGQNHIVEVLLDETNKQRSVVSIWGPGGLGKTTLAHKVYNRTEVKAKFGLLIWVDITQKYEVINVLRNIAQQLHPPIILSKDGGEEALFNLIPKSLEGKQYLIVLDDVWTSNLWTQIQTLFPKENHGSRILITTRSVDVSKDADPMCELYKPEYLTKPLSRVLFLKTVFPNLNPNTSSFDDLSDIIDQFVDKCAGLPLALVVLGGLLSKKPRNHADWSKVLRTMTWHAEGENCSKIISTSYEDLPFALKSCFMYLAAFPKNHSIHAPSLHRMWIAEGFIQQEDNRTLEETAESFLEDLVQRSMVQVSHRYFDDSIAFFHMHDLLRDLALQKAKEDNFLEVYSHPDVQTNLSRARRVAIHTPNCDQLQMSQNLRTLLCFHSIRMPNCSKQRLLKVVTSIGDKTENVIDLGMFEGLTQLRYLKLTGMLSDQCKKECLEKVIGGMKFLQTLDVEGLTTTDGDNKFGLPDCAWHINTLRHVNLNKIVSSFFTSPIPEATLGPPPSANLTNLQTLTSMCTRESWETDSPHLPNLRALKLLHKSNSWKVLATFLATLNNLISLWIESHPIPSEIFHMKKFPFYDSLESLTLYTFSFESPNEMVLYEDMLPRHLTSLTITNYMFKQDPMPMLEKLQCLKKLMLVRACKNRKMSCSSGGFSQLELLILVFLSTEEWEIERDAMPILKELRISFCIQLGVPQGLKYLTKLQKLKWSVDVDKADMVHNLCEHVPSLDFD